MVFNICNFQNIPLPDQILFFFFFINFKLLQTQYQKQKKLLNFEGKKEETIDKRQKLKIKEKK